MKTRANGMCEAAQHEPDCNRIGNECDHITAGDNHSLQNLQWLSPPCHAAKTKREAQAAHPYSGNRKRKPARPPGLA